MQGKQKHFQYLCGDFNIIMYRQPLPEEEPLEGDQNQNQVQG